MPLFPSVLPSASSLCPDPPLVLHPFSQTAKHLRLPAPPSLLHQWSPQAQLSKSPRGGEQSGVPGLRSTQEGVSQCERTFV